MILPPFVRGLTPVHCRAREQGGSWGNAWVSEGRHLLVVIDFGLAGGLCNGCCSLGCLTRALFLEINKIPSELLTIGRLSELEESFLDREPSKSFAERPSALSGMALFSLACKLRI
jgi:hypothetical protein